jgi:hypothetical protein
MAGLEQQNTTEEVNPVFILQVAFIIVCIVFLACLAFGGII